MSEELTVEELVKTLHLCAEKTKNGETCITGQKDCPFGVTVMDCIERMNLAAADSLESLTAERNEYRDKLEKALAENTRLAEKVQTTHAHWTNKNDENVYVCSNCGHYCREFLMKKSGDIPIQGFCTECGAIMDEREDNHESKH